jgi:hypothetical protein
MKLRQLAIAGYAAGITLLVPTSAFALVSTIQAGYSQDLNGVTAVQACDTKADGHSFYAEYTRNGSSGGARIETFGGKSSCAGTSNGATIYKHRGCENIPFSPDPCGQTQFP